MRFFLILTVALNLIFLPELIAQDKPAEDVSVEDFFRLYQEGTVITSTRTERQLKTVPHAVTVITRKQIEESGASTLSEVLRTVPGLNSRVTPMGSQIGIRSFGSTPFSERVLFLIDGTPYNSPDKGGYPGHPAYEDFFPLEAIRRIEVIKGPGSALYGQNAFFGIINIITDDFKGTNNIVGTAGSREVASVVTRGGGGGTGWQYTYLGKYKHQNGPMRFLAAPDETPNIPPLPPNSLFKTEPTEVESGDLYLKARNRGFAVSYLYHRDETESYSWVKPRPVAGFNVDPGCCLTIPTTQTLQFVDATYDKKFEGGDNFRFKAFYNRRKGNTCENCHNNLNTQVANEDETNQRFFFNLQYDLTHRNHRIIVGSDIQADRTEKDIAKLAAGVDESVNTFAGYIQDEITLLDEKLIATLGIRVDHNDKTDNSFSPSVSAVFLPTDALVIRAMYGRAFRQPTWNDLFIETRYHPVNPTPFDFAGNGTASFLQQGNPNLDTEQIDTFEIGFQYFFTRTLTGKFDYFHNRVQDFIEAYDFRRTPAFNPAACDPRVTTCPGTTFLARTTNLGDELTNQGFEAELSFKPVRQFSGSIGYAFQRNDFDILRTGHFLDAYSPEHKVTAILNVHPIDPLLFNLSLNHWSKYNTRTFAADAACTACTNVDPVGQPYTYANFKTTYSIPVGGDQRLGLGFTVRNLFDEQLQLSHAFRVDSALYGREFFGSVDFEF